MVASPASKCVQFAASFVSFWTRSRGEGCTQDADATSEDLLLDFIGICLFDLLFPPFLLDFQCVFCTTRCGQLCGYWILESKLSRRVGKKAHIPAQNPTAKSSKKSAANSANPTRECEQRWTTWCAWWEIPLCATSPLVRESEGRCAGPPFSPPRCEFAVGAAWLGVGFVRVTSSESDEDRGEGGEGPGREGRGSPPWSRSRGAQRAAAHTPLLTPPRALAAASWWSLANHWKHVRIYHNNKVTRRVTHTCSLLYPPQLAFFLFPPKSASFFTRLAFFRCGGCSVRTNTCHTRVLRLPLSLCFRAFRLQESSNFSLLLCSSSRQHRRNVFTSSSEAAQLPF